MRPSQVRALILLVLSLALISWAVPTAANFLIEYNWWKELAQVNTWVSMMWYSVVPAAAGALVAFIALYLAHTVWLAVRGHSPARSPRLLSHRSRRSCPVRDHVRVIRHRFLESS